MRAATIELLDRVVGHEAGRHFWAHLGRFAKAAYIRAKREAQGSSEFGAPVGLGLGMESPVEGGGSWGPAGGLDGRVLGDGTIRGS